MKQLRSLRRALVTGTVVLGSVLGASIVAPPAGAAGPTAGFDGACEGELFRLHNEARSRAGLPALREDPSYNQVTRAWAVRMVRENRLRHNPSYAAQIAPHVPSWRRMAENVGRGASAASQHAAYMSSSGHRSNILSPHHQRVAVACYRDGRGQVWTALNFVTATAGISSRDVAPFRSSGDAASRLRWWLLNAAPSSAAIEADTDRLLRGTSIATYAADLAGSTTHQQTAEATTRLFSAAFLRAPDAPGLSYWIRRRQSGTPLRVIANAYLVSGEFQDRYGRPDNTAFIRMMYRNVLGREADADGLRYWSGRLAAGVPRADVLVSFSESGEYRYRTRIDVPISWAHVQLLGRAPSTGARIDWRTRLASGQSARTLVATIVGSSEFAARARTGSY